jgi:hypothetical protein
MKTFTRPAALILTCLIYCLFASSSIQAQDPPTNIQINDVDNVNANSDGIKAMAVLVDTVYTVWVDKRVNDKNNVYFSKSIDGGESFSTDVLVYNGPDSISHEFAAIAVNEVGIIQITWTAISNNEQFWNIWATHSTDGGTTFENPIKITNSNVCAFSNIDVYQNNVYIFYANLTSYPIVNYYFIRSTNGGLSFESPIQVNDATCISEVYDFESSIAVDASGTIYVAWADGRRANGHGDICFAKSTNSGLSFSDNIIVNDISTPVGDSAQYSPRIAIGSSEKIYIIFKDSRLGSDSWENRRLYFSASTNGGNSFSPEVLMANHNVVCLKHDIAAIDDKVVVALCTNVISNGGWGVWNFESNNGGENFSEPTPFFDEPAVNFSGLNLIMTPNQNLYVIWNDDREELENNNLYFAKIDNSSKIEETKLSSNFTVYPNPTSGLFSICCNKNIQSANVSIYNIQGQVVFENKFSDLNETMAIDLPEGIYFLTLRSNNEIKTIKLIKE